MKLLKRIFLQSPLLISTIGVLLVTSFLVLRSIAPFVFPVYYVYFVLGVLIFILFSQMDFEILTLFSKHLFVFSIVLLLVPLIIGQVTRGAVRWIPIGPLTLQPSEIVRPLLFIFFAKFLTEKEVTIKRLIKSLMILAVPLVLILIQPSLGVTVLTAVGFIGILWASSFDKRLFLLFTLIGVVISPLIWLSLQDYQKGRILTFLSPTADPTGAGYNSLQSMISVGSGQFWGRGLGEGVQTQLSFLPERHTDFIFASMAEELGFAGSIFLMGASFVLLYVIIQSLYKAKSVVSRCFISGLFMTLFTQTMVHIGMNMGIFPITGVPLPLVSAGGSSLLATMMALGLLVSSTKKR